MSFPIFCPSNHLILAEDRCPVCGWMRPAASEVGKLTWGPVELKAGLGGPGRNILAKPAAAKGVVVFPLNSGELAGLNLADGYLRWRKALEPGRVLRGLVAADEELFAGVNDERSLEEAGMGSLVSVDPLTGKIRPLWEASGHHLTDPLITSDQILVRTSKPELVALDRQQPGSILWQQALESWWPEMPVILGDTVVLWDGSPIHETGGLKAFSRSNGQMLWTIPTDGPVTGCPATDGKLLFYRNGKKQLIAVDPADGGERWMQTYATLYSTPCFAAGWVWVVVRGENNPTSSRHYLLQALNPIDGKVRWETPVHQRVSQRPYLDCNTLLLGGENGLIMAYSAENGAFLWEVALGSDENPLRSELAVYDGRLVAGTYLGQAFALQIHNEPMSCQNPEAALQQGDYLEAATALVLQGDFQRSAELYSTQLKDSGKAYLLYEYAHLWKEAGNLARQESLLPKALHYFEQEGDLNAQAEVLVEMGDFLSAARRYEQVGNLEIAAQTYEQAGEYRRALELFKSLGKIGEVIRLRPQVPHTLSDIEELEQQGQLQEAGELALKLGESRKAVDLFQQGGESALEVDALQRFVLASQEPWAYQRLAALTHQSGHFKEEAQAWEHLDECQKAAEAYERAARQVMQLSRGNEAEISRLYERAAHFFEEAGLEPERLSCWQGVVTYGHLPAIEIEGHLERKFHEGEFNTLELVIHNTGYGVAQKILVQPESNRFEIEETNGRMMINRLAPNNSRPVKIYLRPKVGQIGEAVPLVLEWTWEDRQGHKYSGQNSTPVTVQRKNEHEPSSEPRIVNIGTFIQGDKIDGDVVKAGGQKGDKVEINREGGIRLQLENKEKKDEEVRLCPNCHLPIIEEGPVCQECGHSLT